MSLPALFSPPSIRRIESSGSAAARRPATTQPAIPPTMVSVVRLCVGGGWEAVHVPPQIMMSTSSSPWAILLVIGIFGVGQNSGNGWTVGFDSVVAKGGLLWLKTVYFAEAGATERLSRDKGEALHHSFYKAEYAMPEPLYAFRRYLTFMHVLM